MKIKTLGLCPKPRKLLKKFDQNFIFGNFLRHIQPVTPCNRLNSHSKVPKKWGLGTSPQRGLGQRPKVLTLSYSASQGRGI